MRKHLKDILNNELLTPPEAAKKLGMTVDGIRKRLQRKTLDSVIKGNTRLIDIEDLK